MNMSVADVDTSHGLEGWKGPLDEAMASASPLVLRGLCRDWPLVREARNSPSAFAGALAALANETPVDVLRMPPEAGGVVGYNEALDGFNYQHFMVNMTEVLQRLAAFSRHEGPVPGRRARP